MYAVVQVVVALSSGITHPFPGHPIVTTTNVHDSVIGHRVHTSSSIRFYGSEPRALDDVGPVDVAPGQPDTVQ